MLKIDDIKKIIHLIDDSSIHEFTYEANGEKIKLKKADDANSTAEWESEPIEAVLRDDSNQAKEVLQQPETDASDGTAETAFDHEIVAPMVGTVYQAPSPESDPYVSVGSKITKDSIVCIVEAMKLFNEIEAEVSGEIVEVLVENGELVEYGQPLFRVKTE